MATKAQKFLSKTATKLQKYVDKPREEEKQFINQPVMQPTPQPTQAAQQEQPTTLKQPEVIRDPSGEMKGITTTSGRTYLGISPADIRAIAAKNINKTQLPAGTQEAGTQLALLRQQQIGAELAQQVGQTGGIMQPLGATPIDYREAAGAGLANVAPGAIGGAVGGAVLGGTLGTAVAPGVGTLGGAALGAVGGILTSFLIGARGNIKNNMGDEIAAKKLTLTRGTTQLKTLITDTNQNPQNALDNYEMFNTQLQIIDQNYAELHLDTQRNLNKWLNADGRRELEQYEIYYANIRPLLVQRMQTALINPNPTKIELSMDDIADYEEE